LHLISIQDSEDRIKTDHKNTRSRSRRKTLEAPKHQMSHPSTKHITRTNKRQSEHHRCSFEMQMHKKKKNEHGQSRGEAEEKHRGRKQQKGGREEEKTNETELNHIHGRMSSVGKAPVGLLTVQPIAFELLARLKRDEVSPDLDIFPALLLL